MSQKEQTKKVKMTPQQRKVFIPVLIGLIVFSLVCGANTAVSSAFVLFATKFEVSITQVVLANSCLTAAGFIMMQFSGKFMVRFGAKKSILVSLAGIAVGFAICSMATNVYMVWVGFACMATTQAFGQSNAFAAVVRGWVAPKYQGTYIGTIAGFSACGVAIWPALGGALFQGLGISTAFLVLIPCFLIPGFLAAIFLIKDKAKDCDVAPIGWSEEDVQVSAGQAAGKTLDQGGKRFAPFKSPAFWVCAVAMILTVVLFSQLTLLSTSLQMAGLSTGLAAAITSIVSLIAFPVNIVAGRLLDRFGIRLLTILSYGMVIVSSVCMYVFFTTGNTVFLWLFVLTNALCRPYMSQYVFAASHIFKGNATLVQPRMQSFISLGSIFITPLVSSLAEKWGGYTNMAWVWVACAAAIIVVWFIAFKLGEKEQATRLNAANAS